MRKLTFRLQIASDCEEIHPLHGPKHPYGNATGLYETVDFEFKPGKGWQIYGETFGEFSATGTDEDLKATILRYIAKSFGYDLAQPISAHELKAEIEQIVREANPGKV